MKLKRDDSRPDRSALMPERAVRKLDRADLRPERGDYRLLRRI